MKINMKHPEGGLSLAFVAETTGGQLVLQGIREIPLISCACTDSREADPNTMFCAIRGERVDGHNYMASTVQQGCRAFLCERVPEALLPPFAAVVVKDTVAALSDLARGYRQRYLKNLLPVAVTGSVGKTTTKECVAAVLSQSKQLFKKDGNFNSVIGLPLSVLEIGENCECAVLEMGMSGFGEISAMTGAVHPHIAMVTNIGHAHMELLGSREGIARAKLEIAESMGEGDILLVNGDEPLLNDTVLAPIRAKGVRILRLSMSDPLAEAYIHGVTPREGGMSFSLSVAGKTWENCYIPAMGIHMVWAAAFAAVTGYCLGMSCADVQTGLSTYRPAAMRQNVYQMGDVTFIEDCYNASPESMRAAFSVLTLTAKSRMIAVLGDMKELGESQVRLHRETGKALVSAAQDRELMMVTVGELGQELAKGAMEAGLPADRICAFAKDVPYAEASEHIKAMMQAGDTLLFKASRSMGLETLIQGIKDEK